MITASDDESIQIWGVKGMNLIPFEGEEFPPKDVKVINAPLPGDLESESEEDNASTDEFDDSF